MSSEGEKIRALFDSANASRSPMKILRGSRVIIIAAIVFIGVVMFMMRPSSGSYNNLWGLNEVREYTGNRDQSGDDEGAGDAGLIESEDFVSAPKDSVIPNKLVLDNLLSDMKSSLMMNLNMSAEDIDVRPCAKSRVAEDPGIRAGVPVQFIHLPKAGGTTIQDVMRSLAEKNGITPVTQDLGPEACNSRVSSRKGMMLMGHRGWGYCGRVRDKMKPFYIVAVREPVSRLVSMYDYVMKTYATKRMFNLYHKHWGVTDNLNDLVRKLNTTEEDKNPSKAREMIEGLANQQVRFMCGFECHGKKSYGIPLPDITERALLNLRKTDAVVTLNNLNDLTVQLKHHLTFFPMNMKAWPEKNVVQVKKSKVDDDVRQLLEKWAWADRLLFEAAKIEEQDRTILAKRCVKARTSVKKGLR